MQENMKEYFSEKEVRERRLAIYTEKIQETVLNKSAETIRSLVDERHNQKMTQQEISDITGIKAVKSGPLRERRKSAHLNSIREICQCSWETHRNKNL